MSWIYKLYETYENCQPAIGVVTSEKEVPLLPICHTTQKAQVEIVIDHKGNFKRARIVPKDNARTIIPCTESSGGRTSGEAPHPLNDKLQYVAQDYKEFGGNKKPYFESYISSLRAWCESSFSHPKALAVLEYIKKGRVIKDLIEHKILIVGDDGKVIEKPKKKGKDVQDIFKVLNDQSDAFIRWEVEIPNDTCSKIWEDKTLWEKWIDYYSYTKKNKNLCYVTGEELYMADIQPAKLRNDGDKAKLISSNDWDGFTFRGRFTDTKENNTYQTCGVGFEITQKAHSALRWLISRQGYRNGDQAIVAWATSGKQIPNPLDDSLSILGEDDLASDNAGTVSTAQNIALKLNKKLAGYKSDLGDTSRIVIIGLDSATPGRMAITFYRELTGADFMQRVEKWHETCAWIHDYRFIEDKTSIKNKRRHIRFIGAPAPRDIAEAAYGSKVDDKLKKATVERLLPCIIDGQKIPRDIIDSAVRRASNRVGMEEWEWNKTLSIACALYRKLNEREGYSMALDTNRKTREYLYGRLLAIADRLEGHALYKSGEKRDTNAARYMQRFADRPNKTWRQIYLSLSPYMARLGGAKYYKDMIDEVMCKFDPVEDFNSDKPLSGEFLLGYHCQRSALWKKEDEEVSEQE